MSYRKECKKAALSLSREKRQEVLDMMRKGRLSIGEAAKRCEITTQEVLGIMDLNIVKHTFYTVNKESV